MRRCFRPTCTSKFTFRMCWFCCCQCHCLWHCQWHFFCQCFMPMSMTLYKMSKSPIMSVMDWCILNSLFIFLSEILIRWLWCQFHWWYQYHWWCLCHYYIVCQCHTSSQCCCMIKLQCYDMSLWLDFKFVSDDVADQFWGVTINCGFQIKKIKNRKWDSSEICNLLVWNYAYMYLKMLNCYYLMTTDFSDFHNAHV